MPPAGPGRGQNSRPKASSGRAHVREVESLQPPESDLSQPHISSVPNLICFVHGGEPTAADYNVAYRTGTEAVADASNLLRQPLVPVRPWQRLWDDSSRDLHLPRHGHAVGEGSSRGEWRTAGLAYPCSCNFPLWPRAFAPPIPPPMASELAQLASHPEPAQTPVFGHDVLPWSTEEDAEAELDAALDLLDDFECQWKYAEPWPRRGKGKGRAPPPSSSADSSQQSPATFFTQRSLSSPRPRRLQFDASTSCDSVLLKDEPPSPQLHPPLRPSPRPPARAETQTPPPSSAISTPTVDDSSLSDDYVEDARLRRAWWRDRASGFGAFWPSLQRITYPAPSSQAVKRRRRSARDDAYRIARNMDDFAHPFHPDVAHYCAKAKARVYWLIPIHGPVIVPGLQDPVSDPAARPWASRAEFAQAHTPPQSPLWKPRLLQWTPALLNLFLKTRFEPAWMDPERPYGPLHLSFSGPKPDPYLALRPPQPLTTHQHVPWGKEGRAPVRVEAGDHMRIYCDAARAMSFRTWLHWWQVEGERPFDKARFALIGPRGEVLVVA